MKYKISISYHDFIFTDREKASEFLFTAVETYTEKCQFTISKENDDDKEITDNTAETKGK